MPMCMVYGVWCMVHDVWCMVDGGWCMVHGVHSVCMMVCRHLCRVMDRHGRSIGPVLQCIDLRVWCMVYGVWCMVYGVWCIGVWCM